MTNLTMLMPLPDDEEKQPISQSGIDDLVAYGLTIAGHAKTLRYLSDDLQVKFGRTNEWEISQLVELLEFTTLELEDQTSRARNLVEGWGDISRRAKLDAKQT